MRGNFGEAFTAFDERGEGLAFPKNGSPVHVACCEASDRGKKTTIRVSPHLTATVKAHWRGSLTQTNTGYSPCLSNAVNTRVCHVSVFTASH
ncbi:unnamed protein product [Linum trigynum]|uniref:Uncharacterized protein n=1 Tax=Linum trigynum TaxID=586398 RepID=A0AAV2GQ33_9ROSI